MICGYLAPRSTGLVGPRGWGGVDTTIDSNTVSHIGCASATSLVSLTNHAPPTSNPAPVTFVLRLCAGDDPFDQAALHQSFAREPRLLPLSGILHPARRRLHAVGVPQQAAINRFTVHLREGRRGFRSIWKSNKLTWRLCLFWGKYDYPVIWRWFRNISERFRKSSAQHCCGYCYLRTVHPAPLKHFLKGNFCTSHSEPVYIKWQLTAATLHCLITGLCPPLPQHTPSLGLNRSQDVSLSTPFMSQLLCPQPQPTPEKYMLSTVTLFHLANSSYRGERCWLLTVVMSSCYSKASSLHVRHA